MAFSFSRLTLLILLPLTLASLSPQAEKRAPFINERQALTTAAPTGELPFTFTVTYSYLNTYYTYNSGANGISVSTEDITTSTVFTLFATDQAAADSSEAALTRTADFAPTEANPTLRGTAPCHLLKGEATTACKRSSVSPSLSYTPPITSATPLPPGASYYTYTITYTYITFYYTYFPEYDVIGSGTEDFTTTTVISLAATDQAAADTSSSLFKTNEIPWPRQTETTLRGDPPCWYKKKTDAEISAACSGFYATHTTLSGGSSPASTTSTMPVVTGGAGAFSARNGLGGRGSVSGVWVLGAVSVLTGILMVLL